METLDRRISASTDQLDTLRREKRSERTVWDASQQRQSADVTGRHSRHGSRPATSASCHSKRPRSVTRHNHPPEVDVEKLMEENNNEVPFSATTGSFLLL
jgi:hypothetical protein